MSFERVHRVTAVACTVLGLGTLIGVGAAPSLPGGEEPRLMEGRETQAGGADVHRSMERMDRAAEALLKSLDDPAGKNESLRLLGEMQRHCVAAKNEAVPAEVLKKAPDEETKAKWSNLYRRQLLATLRLLTDAEIAVLDHEPRKARKIMDEVQALRVAAHKELGVEDRPW